ncbi:MAG: signal peptidase II [Rhodobiaceae bacterium]|nr:signal peptidase II [Rhodobiaceae bacterium]RPF97237.1 MAG: signal peptidase II [Rhizobiales bacterium TMED227]
MIIDNIKFLLHYKRYIIHIGTLFLFDRLTKVYLLNLLSDNKEPIIITDFLDLVLVWNQGISYGLFPQDSYAGQLIISIISLLICLWAIKIINSSGNKYGMISSILIISGAISNIMDRLIYSAVADFFYFHIKNFSWYVFNVADIYIVMGLFILIYGYIYPNIKKNRI